MNYYTATQLAQDGQPTGLWHFTITNGDRTRPTGYCAEGCPGHVSPDEAREHYRQYLLDTAGYDHKATSARHCEVCKEWTPRFVQVGPGGMEIHTLCDEHYNREGLGQVLPLPADMWASF